MRPLPWHHTVWHTWYQAALSAKLPHALLLKGPPNSGKLLFIKSFAKLMLCTQPKYLDQTSIHYACNDCSACLSYYANTHPNYYEVKPKLETTKPKILIDQIRELTYALQQTATNHKTSTKQHTYQTIVVIDSLELLGTAQHAFLKTLEEPRIGVLFLLTSAHPQALEATIKSRCQCVSLPQPDLAQGMHWLKSTLSDDVTNIATDDNSLTVALALAGNRPLQALTYLKNNQIAVYETILQSLVDLGIQSYPLEIAEQWMQYPLQQVLTYLMHATNQLVELKLNTNLKDKSLGISHDKMTKFFDQVSITCLLEFWRKLNELYSKYALYNLNPLIALEMLAYSLSNSHSLSRAR